MRNNTFRILADGQTICNDTWKTGLNNNDMIIGPSGAGKTRSYVKPNIMQANESMIIADTKGALLQEVGPVLRASGYHVINMDFTDLGSSYGYNPLDYIRFDKETGKFREQDIMLMAACLAPIETDKDPFWEKSARMYLACMIGYVLECLPKEEHTLEYVAKLYEEMLVPQGMKESNFQKLLKELEARDPDGFTYKKYKLFATSCSAEKTYECIRMFLAEKLDTLIFDGPIRMYNSSRRIDFRELGRKKTAVFLNISDTDRSMDTLVNLFYTQALQALCSSADKDYPDHRLPVPVRFILDDFAANVYIPDFDKIISVIRSREIYVSIILQSISQLEGLYGHEKAMTIINNCDNLLYLGGQDVETARYIGCKSNKTADTILNMPLNEAYLFTRGARPKKVVKYDIQKHARYGELPEAMARRTDASREAEEVIQM